MSSAFQSRHKLIAPMDLNSKLASHLQTIPRSGIRDFFELVIGRDDVISLGVGEPDFVTPWPIREAAMRSLDRGETSYTSNLGLLSLREKISEYVETFFHVPYRGSDEVLITVGVSEALDLASVSYTHLTLPTIYSV